MAEYKKFAVVPTTRLRELELLERTKSVPPKTPPPSAAGNIITAKKINAVLEVLPKILKHRARVLLYYLMNHHDEAGMDDDGRIVYQDKSKGSHFYSLIRYVYAAGPFTPYRPEDTDRFMQLVNQSPVKPVPRSDMLAQWQNLY